MNDQQGPPPSVALTTQTDDVAVEQQSQKVYETMLKSPMVVKMQQRLQFITVFLIVIILILVVWWIYRVFLVPVIDGNYIDPTKGDTYELRSSIWGKLTIIHQPKNSDRATNYYAKSIDDHVYVDEGRRQLVVWYADLVMFYDMDDLTKSLGFIKKIE